MRSEVGIEKSFFIWRFPIHTPLNLLENKIRNRDEIFNEVENG